MRPPKPPDEKCPVCGEMSTYYWEDSDPLDADWVLDAEWWITPWNPFVCGRWCYVRDHEQHGLKWDNAKREWVAA